MGLLKALGNLAMGIAEDMYNSDSTGRMNPEHQEKVNNRNRVIAFQNDAKDMIVARIKGFTYKDYDDYTSGELQLMLETNDIVQAYLGCAADFITDPEEKKKAGILAMSLIFMENNGNPGNEDHREWLLWALEDMKLKLGFFD